MRNWKNVMTIILLALAGLAVVVLALGISLTNFLVDLWWFSSLEYDSYFWLRTLYRYILSGGVTIFFFVIFFMHFWAASRYLGVDQNAFAAVARNTQYQTVLAMFQSGSMRVYVPLSLILAVMIAAPFYTQWEQALLFFFGPESGVKDPVFGEDTSFYLLRLPIIELLQAEMLTTSAILLVAVAFLYWVEHQLVPTERREWPVGARLHMCFLIVITALIYGWGISLEAHTLLYSKAHQPVFFGPGFVELRFVYPLIWGMIGILIVVTASTVHWTYKGSRTAFNVMIGSALVFLLVFGLRHSSFIPGLLDRFLVKPNPVAAERGFMGNNIKATSAAFGLDQIRTIPLTATAGADLIDPHTRENLHNIPIWDPEYLDDVYQQLQGIRPYYSFTDVDTGRYNIKGTVEQVNLAAREINLGKLPTEAQNWENTHLRYTHGYGAVITPASQKADEPMDWFLRDLNLQSKVGFTIEKPDIYFGTENLSYAVVPNRLNIVDISSFDMDSSQNYTGHDGMPISSWFRRLLFAIKMRDEKLFFSVNIDSNSKLLIHRNITDRIKTLAPYLALDKDPYVVVTSRHIYWIQDAYTLSDWYPASQPTKFTFASNEKPQAQEFNYIRNSVKIVVDAFDGTVDFYVADPTDPVILGYQKAYPGVFKELTAMSPLLREQLRYPRDIFSVQMGVYAKYHQTDPALFYQQAETWDFAKVDNAPMKPFYFTTYLEGAEDMQNFVLLNAMTPIQRNNLSMIGVAGSLKDGVTGKPYSPKVMIYKFSRDVQVNGPSQVSALIDQDPEIARLFALWDQKGSHVQRGRMIMLPIGRSLLYVQPVYIVSTASTKIPELARVILSMGNIVVMDTSLEKALDRLEARIKQTAQTNNHAAPIPQEATPSATASPL